MQEQSKNNQLLTNTFVVLILLWLSFEQLISMGVNLHHDHSATSLTFTNFHKSCFWLFFLGFAAHLLNRPTPFNNNPSKWATNAWALYLIALGVFIFFRSLNTSAFEADILKKLVFEVGEFVHTPIIVLFAFFCISASDFAKFKGNRKLGNIIELISLPIILEITTKTIDAIITLNSATGQDNEIAYISTILVIFYAAINSKHSGLFSHLVTPQFPRTISVLSIGLLTAIVAKISIKQILKVNDTTGLLLSVIIIALITALVAFIHVRELRNLQKSNLSFDETKIDTKNLRNQNIQVNKEQLTFILKLIDHFTFRSNINTRLLLNGITTYFVMVVAVIFLTPGEIAMPILYPGTAILAASLIFFPDSSWHKLLLLHATANLCAYLSIQSSVSQAIPLILWRLVEGYLLGLSVIRGFRLRLNHNRIQMRRFKQSIALRSVFSSVAVLMSTSLVGAILLRVVSDLPLAQGFKFWAASTLISSGSVYLIFFGILLEVHLGFPRLIMSRIKSIALPVMHACVVTAVYIFGAKFSDNTSIPHLFFVLLSLPLLYWNSLFVASINHAYLVLIFSTLGLSNWINSDIYTEQFTILAPVITAAVGLILTSRIIRQRDIRERRSLIDESPAMLVSYRDDGSIVRGSQILIKYLNDLNEENKYSKHAIIQLNIRNLVSQGKIKVIEGDFFTHATTKISFFVEGKKKYFAAEIKEVSDPTLSHQYVLAMTDVTAQIDKSNQYQAILKTNNYYSLTTTTDLQILDSSKGLDNLLGYALPVSLLDLFVAKDREQLLKSLEDFNTNSMSKIQISGMQLFSNSEQSQFVDIELSEERITSGTYYRFTLTDITKQRILENQKQKQQEILSAFIKGGPQYFLIESENHEILAASEAYANFFYSTSVQKLIGKNSQDLIKDSLFPKARFFIPPSSNQMFKGISDNPTPLEFELSLDAAEKRIFRQHVKILNSKSNSSLRCTVFEDITEIKNSLSTARKFLESGLNPYIIVNRKWDIVFYSEAFADLLGISETDDFTTNLRKITSHNTGVFKAINDAVSNINNHSLVELGSHKIYLTNQDYRHFNIKLRKFEGINSEELLMVGFEDRTPEIISRQKLEEKNIALRQQAYTDPLTQVLNRLAMYEYLKEGSDYRNNKVIRLYMIDIDYFKSVNDAHTHKAGDELLQKISHTLKNILGDNGHLFRLGGEEFLIAKEAGSETEDINFAKNLLDEVKSNPIWVDGYKISRSVSVGIALLDPNGDLSSAMNFSDLALKEAKNTGKDTYVMADEKFIDMLRKRGAFITEPEIERAFDENEFEYFLQPIYNAQTNAIEGHETLIRWRKSSDLVLSPEMFLDRFKTVFNRNQMKANRHKMRECVVSALRHFKNTYISWNFDLDQFANETFIDELRESFGKLKQYGNHTFVFEISEKELYTRQDMSLIIQNLVSLRNDGFLIALDDFGVEHSNIQRLSTLPISLLKLDKCLIDNIETDEMNVTSVRLIAVLASRFSIKCIAEGIERQSQKDALLACNIKSQQGYLFSKPYPVTEVMNQPDDALS